MSSFRKMNILLIVFGLAITPTVFSEMMPAAADTSTATETASNSFASLMAKASIFYDQRDQAGAIEKAIEFYKQALAQNPENYEALWRLSRSYWWQGDHALKADKGTIFDAGKSTAERAQKADPTKTEGYYWFAVNLGRASEVRGIMNSLFAVDPIRKAAEKVLELDPKDGFAHHLLSVLYRKAPGWPLSCGDSNKSLEHAQNAVQYAPEDVLPRIGLAEILLSKGKKDEARQLLEKALTLPGPADKQPETKKDKKEAQELLNKMK